VKKKRAPPAPPALSPPVPSPRYHSIKVTDDVYDAIRQRIAESYAANAKLAEPSRRGYLRPPSVSEVISELLESRVRRTTRRFK